MIEAVGLDVLGNVATDQPHLVIFDAAIGVVERDRPFAQALHLAADQHDAALERVEYLIFVPRLAILSNQPLIIVLPIGSSFLLAFSRKSPRTSVAFPPNSSISRPTPTRHLYRFEPCDSSGTSCCSIFFTRAVYCAATAVQPLLA